jgi:hypothetical protein
MGRVKLNPAEVWVNGVSIHGSERTLDYFRQFSGVLDCETHLNARTLKKLNLCCVIGLNHKIGFCTF